VELQDGFVQNEKIEAIDVALVRLQLAIALSAIDV